MHREYDAHGIGVVAPGEALAALGEACALTRRLWTEREPFDFDGRHYRLTGAICEPKPAQRPGPPIMIGSGGARTGLRIVAEHADIWASPPFTSQDFRRLNALLDAHCDAIGRDPAEITRSAQVFFTATEPADDAARFPGPAGAREQIAEYVEAGARHIVLAPIGASSMRWVADEIIRPAAVPAHLRS
ncbi:MAG TPA: LLM class flavin-dependent oxidoreductase [Trebonia sp.]|nr:LLM class flavin-dependent oxidoreductase [Trebonia sp.]